MKKILLVALNAKYIHSNPAVYCLRAYAKPYREQIEIAEYTINQPLDEILRDIYRRRPDVAAFSCYIWNIEPVSELVRELAQILPEVPLFLGGPEVSYDAKERLSFSPELTGIMTGEGEESFFRLAAYYLEGKGTLSEIPGLVCGTDGTKETILHAEEALCGTPDTGKKDLFFDMPFLYDTKERKEVLPAVFDNRILYYESSRGCPFSCSYCLSSLDKRVRFRDRRLVKEELLWFLENKAPQVKFIDRTFNANREHAMDIWRFLKEHDNGTTNFHFEIGADLLREEELALLNSMRPGLIQLEIGVQSTNPQTLEAVCRHTDMERLKENVRALRAPQNIKLHLDLIAGLPYEDMESFKRSFCEVYSWQPHELQLGFLKVLKGSAMRARKEEYGLCFKPAPPYEVLSTNWLSYADISALKGVEEALEVYYNSGQFVHSLRFLEHFFSSSFALYEAIAAYYEEKRYSFQNQNRARRYELLAEFAAGYLPEEAGRALDELLRYDFHLRRSKGRGKEARLHTEEFLYDRTAAEWGGAIEKRPHRVWFDYTGQHPVTEECLLREEYYGGEETNQ